MSSIAREALESPTPSAWSRCQFLPVQDRRDRAAQIGVKRSREMATLAVQSPAVTKPIERSREHRFFWGMSVVVALVVFIGFARTYYLAGLFDAKPLPAPIVHVHGAVFTSWIAL